MLTAAAICIALAQPSAPYAGEPPRLRLPKPMIPASARSAAGFAPAGWKVEQAIKGDLNRDGRPDLAVILRGVDPDCVVKTEGVASSIDTNPRVLLVAFAGRSGFELRSANAAVIPRMDDPAMDDPLTPDAFAIRAGVLRLGLTYWRSMGGWTSFSSTLSFRWDGRRLALIGFDRETLRRNSGETETLSVNFLTWQAEIVTGSMEDDVDDIRRKVRIPDQNPVYLDAIGDGLEYEPRLPQQR